MAPKFVSGFSVRATRRFLP